MNSWLRDGFRNTALGPAVVIWGFGYVLVDIVGYLLGNSELGLNLIASAPMFVLGVVLTLALDHLRGHLKAATPAVRWAILVTAIFAATAIHSLFDLYWMRWVSIAILPSWQKWALQITLQRLFTAGIVYLWTFCLALTLLWASRLRSDVEASAARAASAEAAAARAEASQHQAEALLHRAEAAALRLQLNPHFLFNSLNSISSLIVLGRGGEAEEMMEKLCDFLRASLNADPTADVPLSQEIDSVDAYLAVESIRFGERLEIDIDVEPGALRAQVPNFILQPLVENAIKHGVAEVAGRATLSVSASSDGEALTLSVSNSSPGATRPRKSGGPGRPRPGIGLSNIRQRLLSCYGDRAWLETGAFRGGYRAVIRLPLVVGRAQAEIKAAAAA